MSPRHGAVNKSDPHLRLEPFLPGGHGYDHIPNMPTSGGFLPFSLLNDCSVSADGLDSGKKSVRADDELLFLALQHHGCFTGSKRGAMLNGVRFSFERYPLPRGKSLESFIILLRVDLFHDVFHTI